MKSNKLICMSKTVFYFGCIILLLIVYLIIDKLTKHVIENIQGVIRFVGPKGKDPVALLPKEVNRIFDSVNNIHAYT